MRGMPGLHLVQKEIGGKVTEDVKIRKVLAESITFSEREPSRGSGRTLTVWSLPALHCAGSLTLPPAGATLGYWLPVFENTLNNHLKSS